MLGEIGRTVRLLIGYFIFFSLLLIFFRFIGPSIGMCSVNGGGRSTVVRCFNLWDFKGTDIFSIYRLSRANNHNLY